jgi:hypothetical protein
MLAVALSFACSKPAPPVPVTPASASAPVTPPPLEPWPPALLARLARAAEAIPNGEIHVGPPADDERDRAIRARFGERCRLERTCGPLWGVDCEAAVDGPYYYLRVRADRLEELATCGGACMGGRCTNCPPSAEGWTCKTY